MSPKQIVINEARIQQPYTSTVHVRNTSAFGIIVRYWFGRKDATFNADDQNEVLVVSAGQTLDIPVTVQLPAAEHEMAYLTILAEFQDRRDTLTYVPVYAYADTSATTSVNEKGALIRYTVWPNPASSSVLWNASFAGEMFRIVDATGTVVDSVISDTYNNATWNPIGPGIYYIYRSYGVAKVVVQ